MVFLGMKRKVEKWFMKLINVQNNFWEAKGGEKTKHN